MRYVSDISKTCDFFLLFNKREFFPFVYKRETTVISEFQIILLQSKCTWQKKFFCKMFQLLVPYYMKFWRHVNLAILKNPQLATF